MVGDEMRKLKSQYRQSCCKPLNICQTQVTAMF